MIPKLDIYLLFSENAFILIQPQPGNDPNGLLLKVLQLTSTYHEVVHSPSDNLYAILHSGNVQLPDNSTSCIVRVVDQRPGMNQPCLMLHIGQAKLVRQEGIPKRLFVFQDD